MPPRRDPVSEVLDQAAARLLAAVYSRDVGEWASLPLPDPAPSTIRYFSGEWGIELLGADNAPTASGKRQDAHTRWGRGFVRALHWQHKHGRRGVPPLQVQWGRRLEPRGTGFRGGRAVRARLRKGGAAAAAAAVDELSFTDRIYAYDGGPGGRWSDPAGRDW